VDSKISDEVLQGLKQRPPFLFVDKIIKRSSDEIVCTKFISEQEDFFRGHFPGNPIMPGVLLQEAVFQTGSLLLSEQKMATNSVGVVTRVERAKFKNFVLPNSELVITVRLKEQLSNAYFMQGKVQVEQKTVLTIEFACAIVNQEQ
jgi:3-hydroxyacyl-[acyl-carrier-protein] dehydratase